MCTKIKISQKTSLENPPSQVESAPEPASSASEPSAPPGDGEAGDGKEEVLTFNPTAEEDWLWWMFWGGPWPQDIVHVFGRLKNVTGLREAGG